MSNEGLLTLGLAWRGVQIALPNADGKMELTGNVLFFNAAGERVVPQ